MSDMLLDKLEDQGAEIDDALDRFMGDEGFYLKCVREFPDNQNIKALRQAVDAGDAERAMQEVHTLKGVALNLSFVPFVDTCMDMLLDFRGGDEAAAFARIDEVEQAFALWARIITEG